MLKFDPAYKQPKSRQRKFHPYGRGNFLRTMPKRVKMVEGSRKRAADLGVKVVNFASEPVRRYLNLKRISIFKMNLSRRSRLTGFKSRC